MLKISLGIVIGLILLPIIIYFCVKYGTVAFYKGKQFIEKEKTCCDDPYKAKCDQCQEINQADPKNIG